MRNIRNYLRNLTVNRRNGYLFRNMPRQARKTSGTGIYHVMLRGINRQDIFDLY